MAKFKQGDRVRVLNSDSSGYNYGTIEQVGVLLNNFATTPDPTYWIIWDHVKGSAIDYSAKDVEFLWELVGTNDNKPLYYNYSDNTLKGCNHEWAEYFGFNDHYHFCKKCDEKRT